MAENVPASATSTTETTLHIGSASTGNGALVWGTTGTPGGATVDFYTRSHGASGDDHSVNQYIGTPFSNNPAMLYQYHNSWMYRITYTDGVPDWTRLNGEDGLNEFEGYNLITAYPAGTVYQMDGTLVSNADVTLNGSSTPALVYNGATRANNENVLANSWAAPIKIKNFVAGNFTNVEATIYIFNAGSPADGTGGSGDTPGNYSSYSIGTATESDVIPSMQSFSVYTTAANPVLFLDYSELVQKDAAYGLIIPNKAPKHLSETEEQMNLLKLRVEGVNGWADEMRIYIRGDFSTGFENGWDAHKMFGYPEAPQLYALTNDGEMSILCVPTADNTVLGFMRGSKDNEYTFSFDYDGEEELYLNDLTEQQSTPVDANHTYTFVSASGDNAARFVISTVPIGKTPTGVEEAHSDSIRHTNVRKIRINDHIYIIRDGRMYNITGTLIR